MEKLNEKELIHEISDYIDTVLVSCEEANITGEEKMSSIAVALEDIGFDKPKNF